jgi:hypothetical protein
MLLLLFFSYLINKFYLLSLFFCVVYLSQRVEPSEWVGTVLAYAKAQTSRGAQGWESKVWEEMGGADAVLEEYERKRQREVHGKEEGVD